MSADCTYRLTLHVSHPKVPASEIESEFGLPIRFSQSVGEQKRTKTGKVLTGHYKVTSISFQLHKFPLHCHDVEIDDLLRSQLERYDLGYIAWLVESGGRCNFFLGVFCSDSFMFEIDNKIIKTLATAGMGLKFDFYGGEDAGVKESE